MSNTAEVTPYAEPARTVERDAISEWLVARADAAVVTRREQNRQARLSHVALPLQLRDAEPFLRSAQSLGYRTLPSVVGSGLPAFLLDRGNGDRLALVSSADGRFELRAAGETHRATAAIGRYTLDRTLAHFAKRGMKISQARLADGGTQVVASEASPGSDGAARVTAQVRSDGKATVNIDGVEGNRCEQILADYAESVSVGVGAVRFKDAYHRRPAGATRVRY